MIYWVSNKIGDINYFTKLYNAKQTAVNFSSKCPIYIEAYEGNKPGSGGYLKYILEYDGKIFRRVISK